MVCGLSEDTTEFVPLQNVSWQTLGRPKIHENESKTYYLTPLYHFIGMRSDFERNNFWPFLTNFQSFDPVRIPLNTQNS